MRTTNNAARGGPLAALLLLLVLALSFSAIAGERIRIEQTLEWAELEEGLTGLPEKVDLTLLLKGLGPTEGFPIDCLLIIDTSATADLSSAKSFAFDLIEQFDEEDRIGLVSYASTARLDIPLTENRIVLKTAIGDLRRDGKSALGDAMQIARRELTLVGREDAVLVEILLSDGQSNTGIEPDVEGEIAADVGIRVISVGIGALINRNLLQAFASDTDGLYFPRPTEAALTEIKDHLDIDIVASDVEIKKELPEGLRLISSTPNAYRTDTDSEGITSATWRVVDLVIDQEIEFTLEIEAVEIGAWSDDLDLLVTYTDFRGVEGSEMFPPPNWPPIAMFEYEPLAPTTVGSISFTDKSEDTNEDGKIVKWVWEFGEETVSSLQNPEFLFTERGTYMVRLTVIDDQGSKSLAYSEAITVGNSAPIAGFVLRDLETMAQIARPHLGVTTLLDASMSFDLDGDIEFYYWDFDDDGDIDLETDSASTEFAFEELGSHEVTVIVLDDEGTGGAYSQIVDVLPRVVAMFEYEPLAPTTAEMISFTDLSEDMNDEGEIISWAWEFGEDAVSSLQNPEYRFSERGTYEVTLTVTDDRGSESIAYEQEIIVGNAAPNAGFVLRDPDTMVEYVQPHLGVMTMLDASMSYDLDGDIELYKWDLDGDGIIDLETESSDIEHAFEEPGEVELSLTVVDDEGKTETVDKTVDILASVLAERVINSCMPDDWTVPDSAVQVSIILSVNTLLNGLTVSETIPEGWAFTEVDNDGANRRENGQTMEWVFWDEFMDDGINEQREIKYTLTSPATITDDLVQGNMSGMVGSSSPRVSLPISGEDRVTVAKVLPIPVVISRWNTVDSKLDPCLLELIAFDQINYALALWFSGDEVPYSGGLSIDLLTFQDLIAYWLTDSSVHDPLP
ncbi:PKD domain-containing protein [Candidatus Bipolaricaulota bacterium]